MYANLIAMDLFTHIGLTPIPAYRYVAISPLAPIGDSCPVRPVGGTRAGVSLGS